jgi:polysaccharide biosynthesis/export protein
MSIRRRLSYLAVLSALFACIAASAAGEDYVLGPGDTIAVTVFDHPELSMPSIQIRPDGKIGHPFLGEMQVAGTTPQELARTVAANLSDELREPIVTVNVTGFRENKVYILGEVAAPGAFPADMPLTVAKAIALAGDMTERADRRKATLIPKDGEPRAIDIHKALTAASGAELLLQAGDTLILLPADNTVIVWGEVSNPGKYELPPGSNTILDALAAAGGMGPTANRREATVIHRDDKLEKIDLEAILQDHDRAADVTLLGGDLLIISAYRNEVMMMGAVNSQGPINIVAGDRLSDLIALAGGLSETADMENVRVMRDPDTVFIVNARAILKEYNMDANIEVKAGDVVFVPEVRREVLVFGSVSSPGTYTFREDDRLLDILARTGGFVEGKTSPGKTALVRMEGQEAKVYLVNANELIRGRQPEKNFRLQDKDVIIVPHKTGTDWREIVGIIYQAATMIRIFE